MSREEVSRGRVSAQAISAPVAVDIPAAANDNGAIAVPAKLDLLDQINKLPFEKLLAADACFWGDIVKFILMHL